MRNLPAYNTSLSTNHLGLFRPGNITARGNRSQCLRRTSNSICNVVSAWNRSRYLSCGSSERRVGSCTVLLNYDALCNSFSQLQNRDIKAPIILQVSQGGSAYFAGKGLANDKQQASILGAIAAAHHVRTVAKEYGV